jgi:hypothetical protein
MDGMNSQQRNGSPAWRMGSAEGRVAIIIIMTTPSSSLLLNISNTVPQLIDPQLLLQRRAAPLIGVLIKRYRDD